MGILLLLFTVVPIVELFILIEVGQIIGAWDTVAIVLITGIVGAYMARSQGLSIWLSTQKQMAKGEIPADNLIHGFLILVGGILLITPGILTDIFGLSLVFPLTRALYISGVKKFFQKRMESGNFQVYTNVNGQWTGSEEWRDVSLGREPKPLRGPAKVIDLKSYKPNQD